MSYTTLVATLYTKYRTGTIDIIEFNDRQRRLMWRWIREAERYGKGMQGLS